jgi:F0F1-type ATP synthase assembly protein I
VLQNLNSFAYRALHEWNHGLTIGVGFGWLTQSVEMAGKLLGVVALLIGIGCSVRREIRESRAARPRVPQ